jgi:dihydroorotate dehydrogenase
MRRWSPPCEVIAESGIDGLIATNTTLDRSAVAGPSPTPARAAASAARRCSRARQPGAHQLSPRRPRRRLRTIIGLGGISPRRGRGGQKRALGADLVQIYTGFIYHGPALVHACARALAAARSERACRLSFFAMSTWHR